MAEAQEVGSMSAAVETFRRESVGSWGRAIPGTGVVQVRVRAPSPEGAIVTSWQDRAALSPDPALVAHDASERAHGELRSLLDGDASRGPPDEAQMRDLVDALDKALAGPLHPDERRRLEKLGGVRGLVETRPSLA